MKHTPEPWKIGITLDRGWPVYRLMEMYNPFDDEEQQANADLMEAAPRLLKTGERILRFVDDEPTCTCERCQTIRDFKAIITKARG